MDRSHPLGRVGYVPTACLSSPAICLQGARHD